ncbi:RNAse P Rpr2/Rpp21/SNM1 subunit domain-containing protein [Pseudomassariella vexata]|uniref:RNAse P Rpr2/Rpp21/SNM1 subunit domain-containing protein n=1 Tax=Pseudomassariella vexata TaxID=1141098 RepID=A0A1Y2E7F5_9PEZI|nr:RNAse P Rpr2/Rpp21/SNM1 subunit domain-containing protein [Pseudomassariella vexata]ORY67367.1 RNAse P Rpr2/Rpp21/SNM1 subunit domain-containing protein [Pseudomassariella vexata]
MAKQKGSGSVQNRPIYSRLSYLYQAAAHLGSASNDQKIDATTKQALEDGAHSTASQTQKSESHVKQAMARNLLKELRAISHKTQIRISPAIKHTICKSCDTLLVEGDTCTSTVENKSKGGKKPWADVLVVKCKTCGGVKRFPVQAPRQKRRPHREAKAQEEQHQTMVQGENLEAMVQDKQPRAMVQGEQTQAMDTNDG